MLDTIKKLIIDFQEMQIQSGVSRKLELKFAAGKATALIGVRRSGKSTFLLQEIEKLLETGVSKENIVFLNFFDDRLHPLRHGNLNQIVEAYYSLFPYKKNKETVYFFFDEIQALTAWEPFVDRLLRTEKCRVYLTGSSAAMLSREIATQMRGRSVSWELFPFSFPEYLDYRGLEYKPPYSSKTSFILQEAFEQYWQSGGFPEVLGLESSLRVKIHQDYFQTILFRDLVDRHNISHPRALSDLAHRLIDNSASLYTINSLTNYLKSLGHKVPKTTVADYIAWLEDAYFLFTVYIYDPSIARRKTNPKKIYCIDHALVTSTSPTILLNQGHLLENLVYTAIRRTYPESYYYKTKTGKEVDFIIPRSADSPLLIQVTETLLEPSTRQREVAGLREAMHETKTQQGYIITRQEEDQVETKEGIIYVLPAWQYLLKIN